MQRARGQARGDAGVQVRLHLWQGELLFAQVNELIDEGLVTLLGLAQFLGELAAAQQYGEDAPALFVEHQIGHGLYAQIAQQLQR